MADRLLTSGGRYEEVNSGRRRSPPTADRPGEPKKSVQQVNSSLPPSRDEERARLVSEDDSSLLTSRRFPAYVVPAASITVGILLLACFSMSLIALLRPAPSPGASTCRTASATTSPRAPAGVNFGGWLVLEDWFFSGQDGRFVTSADPAGQGVCLPPLARGTVERWPSEGVLVKTLNSTMGPRKTVDIMSAHRHAFIGETDLALLEDLGVQTIRLPITWAVFADALAPLSPHLYGAHNATTDAVIVPDPFHIGKASLVTVPRAWLAQFLRRAAGHGLRVVLDLHSMPGGSSDGTYNGVWPNPPAFWKETAKVGSTAIALRTAGLWVVAALVGWVESLDKEALSGVAGISAMNEPGHMASSNGFAKEEDVLKWLSSSVDLFRRSKLPGLGVKLYVNLIETAFIDFWGAVGPWWQNTFSKAESNDWAVFDQHWYTAWDGGRCDGRALPGGGYVCDQPLDQVRKLLRNCAKNYAQKLSSNVQGLKSCSEFSVGTFADAVIACNDRTLLQAFLEEQISVFEEFNIEPFFWTWRMPHGPSFEMGWSLRRLLGHEESPLLHPCSLPLGVM